MAKDQDNPRGGTGESLNRRGEEIREKDGKEAGRYDTGPKGRSGRPSGKSTSRDATGVDPSEPIDSDSPTGTARG